ncbi:MAG: hypothetical protein IJ604_13235 [Prevotella sp.]|nr:hypothetical protein [Prevotella sp.]MBR1880494.1 hypothetical protein [Prevotella sp.]
MAGSYKFVKLRNGLCAVRHKEPTLFGEEWMTIAAYRHCEVRMRKIAKMLNECEEISKRYGKQRNKET